MNEKRHSVRTQTTVFLLATATAIAALLPSCGPKPPKPDNGAKPDEPAAARVEKVTPAATGKEKFASVKVTRNASNAKEAEAYIKNSDGSVDLKLGPDNANNFYDEGKTCASWIYHSPLEGVIRSDGSAFPDTKQLMVDSGGVYLWTKTQHRGVIGFHVAAYYRTDGKEPFGSRGVGEDGTQVAKFEFSHPSPSSADGEDSWWRVGPLPLPKGDDSFTYKIGIWRD